MASGKKTQAGGGFIYRIIQGRWFSTNFFLKNAVFLLTAMVFLMIYISNKYQVQTKIEQIQHLEQELERVKTETVRERSEYMSRTRESSMRQMIDSLHLGLDTRQQPPYKITVKD